mmetsp:Transcript_14715/g.23938  ORF Transcript_14715/g.23938 Transcript_14715/m.23938 type:complete len:107 (-) Transcript_14715:456-776(-)
MVLLHLFAVPPLFGSSLNPIWQPVTADFVVAVVFVAAVVVEEDELELAAAVLFAFVAVEVVVVEVVDDLVVAAVGVPYMPVTSSSGLAAPLATVLAATAQRNSEDP